MTNANQTRRKMKGFRQRLRGQRPKEKDGKPGENRSQMEVEEPEVRRSPWVLMDDPRGSEREVPIREVSRYDQVVPRTGDLSGVMTEQPNRKAVDRLRELRELRRTSYIRDAEILNFDEVGEDRRPTVAAKMREADDSLREIHNIVNDRDETGTSTTEESRLALTIEKNLGKDGMRLQHQSPPRENVNVVSLEDAQSQLSEAAITNLVNLLKSKKSGRRRTALSALQAGIRLPEIAAINLSQLLGNKNHDIRSAAAVVLREQTELPETAISILIQLLEQNDYDKRYSVSLALQKQNRLPATAVASLARFLEDEDSDLRATARFILGGRSIEAMVTHAQLESTRRPTTQQLETELSSQIWSDKENEPRSHTVAACERCRSAQIRCDGKIPACSACERAGKAGDCYTANENEQKGQRMRKESVHKIEESLRQETERARLKNASGTESEVNEIHDRHDRNLIPLALTDVSPVAKSSDGHLPEASSQDDNAIFVSGPQGQQTISTDTHREHTELAYEEQKSLHSALSFSDAITNSLTASTHDIGGRRRPWRHKGLSCSQCRMRKVWCDGERPCRQCRSGGWTSSCSFPVVERASTGDASLKDYNIKVDAGKSTDLVTPGLPSKDDADAWVRLGNSDLRRQEDEQVLATHLAAAGNAAQSLIDVIRSTPTDKLVSSALVKHYAEQAEKAGETLFAASAYQNLAIDDRFALSLDSTRARVETALMVYQSAISKAKAEVASIEQSNDEEGVPQPKSATGPNRVDSTEGYRSQRVQWTCACGIELFDDYIELAPGSVAKLQARLADETKTRSSRLTYWADFIKEAFTSLSPTSSATTSISTSSPTSHSGVTQNQPESAQPGNSAKPDGRGDQSTPPFIQIRNDSSIPPISNIPERILYLLLCFPVGFTGLRLHHAQILSKQLSNDRQLFHLLGKMYTKGRENVTLTSKLSLRTVTKVSLSHFLVDLSDLVDLKPHSSVCEPVTPGCRCLPPADMISPAPSAEYVCDPAQPDYMPPFGVNYLTHYFQNPSHLNPSSNWVLRQVPKRMAGQLMAGADAGFAKGWGLAFEEGWDRRRIGQRVLALVVLGSLLFGVLFAILKKDIQSAFSISACVISALAIVGGYFGSGEPRGFVHV